MLSAPIAAVAGGTPWRFGAALDVSENYSSNINLSPADQAKSDFVTSITPDFHFSRSGARVNALFDYQPSFLYYARGTNGTQVRNSLFATLQGNVVENLLQVNAQAGITQQVISPFGTQATNNFNGNANRAETRTYMINPVLQSRFSNDLSYQVGYRYYWTDSDNALFARTSTNEAFANISSGTSTRDLGATLSFDRSDQTYSAAQNRIIQQNENVQITYVVSPTFKLIGNIGYDDDKYPATDQPDLKGMTYSAGFDWQPTQRTTVDAQFGHRYFGPTANVHIQHSTPRYVLSFIYTRDQTTSAASGLTGTIDPTFAAVEALLADSFPDPAQRAAAAALALQQAGLAVNQFDISPFLSNQIFVQKRIDLNLVLTGLSNTVSFDVARTDSHGLSALTVGFDIFNQASNIRQTIYSVTWGHKLGPRTTVNFTAQRTQSQAIEGSGTSTLRSLYASVNRQISRKLSGSVTLRNSTQRAGTDNGGLFGGNYRENTVLGTLHVQF